MKRENSVQDYLSRIDRLLRPLPVTERTVSYTHLTLPTNREV